MPTPNRESSPIQDQEVDTASQAGTLAQSPVPTTPSLQGGDYEDDVISLHSSDDSDFDDEVPTHLTTSTRASNADEDEFDFADERE